MKGSELKAWRMNKHWSQAKAGEKMGFSRRNIARLETLEELPAHVVRIVELIEDSEDERCAG